MIIKLDNYNLGSRICSLALDCDSLNELVNAGLQSMFLTEEGLRFYPENILIPISDTLHQTLEECDSFDIFQVFEDGKAYRYYAANGDNYIMMATKCNSNCIMCPMSEYSRKNETAPDVDEILEIIRHMPHDMPHMTITGGEPFMAGPRIFEVLSAFKGRFEYTDFLLLTNGRAFAYKPYVTLFNENAPQNIISGIPLHGYNAATHDAIIQVPGGFNQTLHGIKNLLNSKQLVEIRIVVSKLNCEYIDKIAQLIVDELPDVHRVEIMGLEMLGNAAVNKDRVWIPYREAFLASKAAIELLMKNTIEVGLYNFPLCAVDSDYWHIAKKSISDYKIRYAEGCAGCEVMDACGGIFGGTLRLAGMNVKPVIS